MADINPKLVPIFDCFCKNYCQFNNKGMCTEKFEPASLKVCPAGEWWDLNDYLNHVRLILEKIQGQIPKRL